MKAYARYFGKKFVWLIITFIAALVLNFILPRMMPGDPVAIITQRVTQGMQSQSGNKHSIEYSVIAKLPGKTITLAEHLNSASSKKLVVEYFSNEIMKSGPVFEIE